MVLGLFFCLGAPLFSFAIFLLVTGFLFLLLCIASVIACIFDEEWRNSRQNGVRRDKQNMCELTENGNFRIFTTSRDKGTSGHVVHPPSPCDHTMDCPICLDSMGVSPLDRNRKQICVTRCGHAFHSLCLKKMYDSGVHTPSASTCVKCPMCRKELPGAFGLEEEISTNRYYTCSFFTFSHIPPYA